MSSTKKKPEATKPDPKKNVTQSPAPAAASSKTASSPASAALLNALLPASAASPQTGDDAAAQKQKHMDDAVERFRTISSSLGGHEQAKAFFATYGTEGFKPAEEKERELISGKELTLDSEIKDYSDKKLGMPTRPEGYGAKYIDEQPWEVEEPNEVDVASKLEHEQWQEVVSSTKMLHGYVMDNARGLSRARFQAFQLKPPPGRSYTDGTGVDPDFEVFDSSSISIKETKTQVERSMAQNGFSSTAISASVGVSTPYVGVSASASRSTETGRSSNKGDFADRQEYTATYNFPRARIFLDELNLEVTTQCAKCLVDIQNAANMIKANVDSGAPSDQGGAVTTANRLVAQFFARFGHVFACTVQLGGQLTATKAASSIAASDESQKRDAMQMAAAVSVEAKAVSASSSISHGRSTDVTTANLDVKNSSALAWSARGGNTLLCANPPAWANSVADYKMWRVMEQDNVQLLPDLIASLTLSTNDSAAAWPGIAEVFRVIAQNEFRKIPPVLPGTWTGKLKFETYNGRKLVIKNGELCVSDSGTDAIFQVLDADMRRKDETLPGMPLLYADSPIFLVNGDSPARQSQAEGAQFPGLYVADDGKIKQSDGKKVCRWSLRRGDALPSADSAVDSRWKPNTLRIEHSNEVGLFCHSYHAGGSYISTENPPWFAPYVVEKDGEEALRVWKLDQSWIEIVNNNTKNTRENWQFMNAKRSSNQDLIELSDRNRASPSDEAQVQTYRRIFGPADPQNWTSDHDYLMALFATNLFHKMRQYQDKDLVDEKVAGPHMWSSAKERFGPSLSLNLKTGTVRARNDLGLNKLEPLRLRVLFVN